MIDFVKFEIKGADPDRLQANDLLSFHDKVNVSTGQLKGIYLNAYYKGMEFRIYNPTEANPNRRITLEGSIHKYWNNGAHNFNDFGINEIWEVLSDFDVNFGIKPENCILKSLEIGVNINPPISTKRILQNCLMFKSKHLKWVYTKDEGNYKQADLQRYFLKIYDKQKHYRRRGFELDLEIMRIELKYIKMRSLNERGIFSIGDLLYYGLENFINDLIMAWRSIIYYDHDVFKNTDYKHKYSNPNFWYHLSSRERIDQRKIMNRYFEKSPNNLKFQISNLIREKCEFLNIQTPEINPLHIGLIVGNKVFRKDYQKQRENREKTSGIQEKNRRVCLVTGLNISMQKEDSIVLSHTGLKYYFKTDRKIFEEVKRKYLTKRWQLSDLKTQIKEIAHNIRNTKQSRVRIQNRLYPPLQEQLFPLVNHDEIK